MHQRNPPTHPLQYGRLDARTTAGRTEVMCILLGHVNLQGKESVVGSTQVRLISTTLSYLGLRLNFFTCARGRSLLSHLILYIYKSNKHEKGA
jgi:hypothetical protein